jgi:RNAse (barnase) inhibitor barstar
MKYKELLNFEPITEVVKFSRTGESDYQKSLVKTFVFSDTFKNHLIPLMIRNLDFNYSGESFGLQVVGNYGTGKSHLMSLVSLLAEDASLIDLVNDEKPKKDLRAIAGKFKVLRFELGNTESLWEVITYQIENYLKSQGINFSFDGHGPKPYFDKLLLMMAEFEDKFPDKGFLIVIDEMLAYLKGRSAADKLNQDLAVLQSLGQACDKSKFKFIFGVQEMIYHSPEFQFAADMLQKVHDRYKDIMITKEDVAFIVKNRLLRKDEHQKQKIKSHLDPFLALFTDMHGRTQDYVDLYPVHPTYLKISKKSESGKANVKSLKHYPISSPKF